MKTIKLAVLGMQILADGGAVLITRPSKENPSKNGVHQLAEGQVRRIAQRALGFNSPVALKSLIELGECKLNIDVKECKQGDAFTKKDGTTGTYTKDWVKYENHEIELSDRAKNKIADKALDNGFANMNTSYAPVVKPIVAHEEESDSKTKV